MIVPFADTLLLSSKINWKVYPMESEVLCGVSFLLLFNTEVTKQTSLWVSTGFVQLTAFFVCVIAWLCTGRENVALLTEVRPWYLLTGGILGAFITITVVQSMRSLGPAQAVIIIVTSQVAVAYLIELFGLFGSSQASFSWRKILGLLIAIAGIVLFRWEKA